MNKRQYSHYECGGMVRGFIPLLPYKASNGISIYHSKVSITTEFGVIHSECSVNWNESRDSENYLNPGAKYQPCGYSFTKMFHCDITGFNIESLEIIAKMIAESNEYLANSLLKHRGVQ